MIDWFSSLLILVKHSGVLQRGLIWWIIWTAYLTLVEVNIRRRKIFVMLLMTFFVKASASREIPQCKCNTRCTMSSSFFYGGRGIMFGNWYSNTETSTWVGWCKWKYIDVLRWAYIGSAVSYKRNFYNRWIPSKTEDVKVYTML